ncbi:PtdIns(3,5)P(2) sythesis regulation factor [Coemansia spiralis]|uniref:PtdIns(3,5)P(2) sythesis regulation factor n=3 Tax=Coemansia TaxID=4863 RepID=A0A9W8KVU4_9FUNG|nr:PtdIns(3,5)P(2) sythesis regulation factor [Coemansia spiralis]
MKSGGAGTSRARSSTNEPAKPLGIGRPRQPQPQPQPQQPGTAEQTDEVREVLSQAVQRVQHMAEQSQQSHELFTSLFPAWCHNPASCLTLCLLSQHYEISSELVRVFGQLPNDLTVSFLVQLDKLVQLLESPVFTPLRLQLLDASNTLLVRTLYGLLMLLPQSSAFAILRNRLSAIPGPFPMVVHPSGQQFDGREQKEYHFHYHMHRHPGVSGGARPPVAGGDLRVLSRLLLRAASVDQQQTHNVPTMQILQQMAELQLLALDEAEEQSELPRPNGNYNSNGVRDEEVERLLEKYREVRLRHMEARTQQAI